jgi:hypothetical protein
MKYVVTGKLSTQTNTWRQRWLMDATVAVIIANTLINLNQHMKVDMKRNLQNVLQEIQIKCLLIFLNIRTLHKHKMCLPHHDSHDSHFNITENIPIAFELLPKTEWRLPLVGQFVPSCS